MSNRQYIGIIPARYGSTRFPGKPLALIGGKPMIEHVYRQASKALDEVYVATDDQRIYDTVVGFGGQAIMTRTDHRCGTERCLEAIEWIMDNGEGRRAKGDGEPIVINIQGDEPFIHPEQIEALKACFDDPQTQIATLVKPFEEQDGWEALENPNTPKVVFSHVNRQALLFSRSVIPYLRNIPREQWLKQHVHYKHIGMYAYRADILRQIVALPPTQAELNESLEQLRWLENGYHIRVAETHIQSIGIDTPEDLIKAEKYILT